MSTLYDLKLNLGVISDALAAKAGEIQAKAVDPKADIKEIEALEVEKQNLEKRFNIVKAEVERLEKEAEARLKARLKGTEGISGITDDKQRMIVAKAAFIRAKVEGRDIPNEAREVLNLTTPLRAIPTDDNTGQNLLPTTQSKEVITEPLVTNPLRGQITMTSIAGLEVPKILFSLDDDSFITDAQTAKEIQATGDKVLFGKFKFKVKVRISDTVLHGSDIGLVEYVEDALRSGLAAKEKKVSFASGAGIVAGEKHMTFYEVDADSKYVIKSVGGATLFEAITGAIADLHEDFRENAKVCMRYTDYVTMLKELSNSAVALYGKQPEEIIGKPTFFSDSAVVPIVGDFRYMHLNYDPDTVYDSDKNIDAGDYIWVLTAWIDQKKKLLSAFRLAVVEEGTGG